MSGSKILSMDNVRKRFCEYCGQSLLSHGRNCNYESLMRRVQMLSESNQLIPGILQANREAVEISSHYKNVMEQASKALSIAEEVVKEFEGGDQIWNRFLDRLDKCLKTSAPDIGESQKTSSPESTTPSETGSRQCTEETTPGESTPPDSSR